MANKDDRNALNVPGPWYVDSACIACGLCVGAAPGNFKFSEDGSTALVFSQPASPAELAASAEALSSCPVEAIGNDG